MVVNRPKNWKNIFDDWIKACCLPDDATKKGFCDWWEFEKWNVRFLIFPQSN